MLRSMAGTLRIFLSVSEAKASRFMASTSLKLSALISSG
jgi:hypothetical protein